MNLAWIHGLGESSAVFAPIINAIDGHHTLIDLPHERLGLEQLADWLEAKIPRDAIAIGHSMGGVLAMMLGERGAVRAVVNVEGNISRGDCTISGRAIAYSERDFVARGFEQLRAASERADYAVEMARWPPRTFYRHAQELVAVTETGRLAARQAALGVPSLYIAGVPDGICAESRALLERRGVRWIGIEPAGHWVYLDQPEKFALAIRGLSSRLS